MAARESSAVQSLRSAYGREFLFGHWQRLEDAFAVGLPDVNVHLPGVGDLWIEVKNVPPERMPKRTTTPVKPGLRPEQVIWLYKAKAAGRKVCVLIRLPSLWVWYARDFEYINDRNIHDLINGATFTSPKLVLSEAFAAVVRDDS